MDETPIVGRRVVLAHPDGEIRRGEALGALLVVRNGSSGIVVGSAPESRSVVVVFDDIGQTVGVSVGRRFLAPRPDV